MAVPCHYVEIGGQQYAVAINSPIDCRRSDGGVVAPVQLYILVLAELVLSGVTAPIITSCEFAIYNN